ncbi:hypothetical protein AVEN_67796-1 [Araneus ventricosus]|uniref:Uncharacterized protein n=1 Tax=Araneus ventricosus TaxID=182803 RepID=A0A4Y2J5B2_ARAVE|nr:hypothetical protein AVEN_67796-1 [Araneus ventricosus]
MADIPVLDTHQGMHQPHPMQRKRLVPLWPGVCLLSQYRGEPPRLGGEEEEGRFRERTLLKKLPDGTFKTFGGGNDREKEVGPDFYIRRQTKRIRNRHPPHPYISRNQVMLFFLYSSSPQESLSELKHRFCT